MKRYRLTGRSILRLFMAQTESNMTKPRIGNLRAYLAGTGATGALIAAAVLAFLTVGAIVAFNGFPLGGNDAEGSVSLADQPGGIAPESAAAALGAAAPGAVARTPAGGTVLAAVLPGGAGAGAGSNGGTAPGAPGGPGAGTGTGTGGGTIPTAPGGGTGGGTVGGLVDDVDQTTAGLGLDVPLNDTVGPVADQVDHTVNDTLNNVGGIVGQPHLGDNVNNGLHGVTDHVLGDNGLLGGP